MKLLAGTAAAVTLGALLAVAPANAAVHIVDLGAITLGSYGDASVGFSRRTTTGSFTEYLKFSIAFAGDVSVSYSNAFGSRGGISNGILALNACLTNCTGDVFAPTGTEIDSSPLFSNPLFKRQQFSGFGPDDVFPGSYFLKLTGATPSGSEEGLAYTGTLFFSSGVPEPSTWAMMLIGFAGLAMASSRSKKSVAVA